MSDSLALSKKHGVNPTIPLCPYCEKPKGTVVLTGLAGEKIAKALGNSDGQMPVHVHMPGDVEPCDECREKGIGIVEVNDDGTPTGQLWLVKRNALQGKLKSDVWERVSAAGICLMSPNMTAALGLPKGGSDGK